MTGDTSGGEPPPMTNDPKPEKANPNDRREEVAAAMAACIGGLWSQGQFKASEMIDGTAMALGELVHTVAGLTRSHLGLLLLATCNVVHAIATAKRYELPAEAERPKRCRVCGCTDEKACVDIANGGMACHRVEADLCSVCAGKKSALMILTPGGNGQ